MYKPGRWAEYGLQFYRFNKTHDVWTPDELKSALEGKEQALFLSDDKGLMDLSAIPGIEVKIVKTVGNLSAFWITPVPVPAP